MTKRARDFDEEYSQSKRLRTIDSYAPRRNGVHVQNYDELYGMSTPDFRSKHLIGDCRLQQRLTDVCYFELKTYNYVAFGSNVYYDVSDAVGDLAYDRLYSIFHWGYFDCGHYNCHRSTIIVSNNLLLHIEKSNHPNYDLCFIVEETRCLNEHLDKNEYGLIDHFGPFHRMTC